jgi:hypothetical protein
VFSRASRLAIHPNLKLSNLIWIHSRLLVRTPLGCDTLAVGRVELLADSSESEAKPHFFRWGRTDTQVRMVRYLLSALNGCNTSEEDFYRSGKSNVRQYRENVLSGHRLPHRVGIVSPTWT